MKKNGFFSKKSFKYGSYAFAATAIVVALLVVINAILGLPGVRDRLRFDITKNKLFSISAQSIEIVKKLDKDVDIYILSPENKYGNMMITEVLKQYSVNSNGRIKTQFIDLDRDPTFISKELDPDQVQGINIGDIVVKSGKKIRVLTNDDFIETSYSAYGYGEPTGIKVEQAFTSAIKGVTADKASKIYFVSGHGELSPDEQLSDLKSAILLNNYTTDQITLTAPIPDDADVLFFTAPTSDLLAKELENLMTYLEKGGKAIFLFNVSEKEGEMPNFNKVFNRYYLALNNDIVSEFNQQNYLQENWMIRPMVYQNDVTKNLNPESLFVYLPGSRSVQVLQSDKEWLKNFPLFGTTEKSQSVNLTNATENFGPFFLGALAQLESNGVSKIALIGNCNFVTDSFMAQLGDNGKRYVISILNWMEDKQDTVMIPAKTLEQPPLNLTEQSRIFVFIMLSAIIPLLIIGTGVFVWMRRKNL